MLVRAQQQLPRAAGAAAGRQPAAYAQNPHLIAAGEQTRAAGGAVRILRAQAHSFPDAAVLGVHCRQSPHTRAVVTLKRKSSGVCRAFDYGGRPFSCTSP